MVVYHDSEWGVVEHDSQRLFEALLLESAQAGLSWRTILNKRDGYRQAFGQFSAEHIAALRPVDVDRLLTNPAIVRHRGKIEAFVANARAYLQLLDQGQSFDDFVWQFVGGEPIQNNWRGMSDVPGHTNAAAAMSKALKQAGFKFVGPTTCYAFMQSAGLVNDHLVECFRHQQLRGTG